MPQRPDVAASDTGWLDSDASTVEVTVGDVVARAAIYASGVFAVEAQAPDGRVRYVDGAQLPTADQECALRAFANDELGRACRAATEQLRTTLDAQTSTRVTTTSTRPLGRPVERRPRERRATSRRRRSSSRAGPDDPPRRPASRNPARTRGEASA